MAVCAAVKLRFSCAIKGSPSHAGQGQKSNITTLKRMWPTLPVATCLSNTLQPIHMHPPISGRVETPSVPIPARQRGEGVSGRQAFHPVTTSHSVLPRTFTSSHGCNFREREHPLVLPSSPAPVNCLAWHYLLHLPLLRLPGATRINSRQRFPRYSTTTACVNAASLCVNSLLRLPDHSVSGARDSKAAPLPKLTLHRLTNY